MKVILAVIFVCVASPVSFAQWRTGGGPASINCFATDGGLLFGGWGYSDDLSVPSNGGVSVSSDAGITWTDVDSGAIGLPVFGLQVRGQLMFAAVADSLADLAGGTADSTWVYRSLDGGRSWMRLYLQRGFDQLLWIALHGQNLYATTRQGILLSKDSGMHWNVLTDSVYGPIVFAGDRMFAGSGSQGIVVSLDTGRSWHSVNLPSGRTCAQLFEVDSKIVALLDSAFPSPTQFVAFSGDTGKTWSESRVDSLYYSIAAMAFNGRDLFAVSSTSVGVSSYSTDFGNTWVSMTHGVELSPPYALSLWANEENVVAGARTMSWYYPLSELEVLHPLERSSEFVLYPNPTTGSVTIPSASGSVRLENSLGEQVLPKSSKADGNTIELDLSSLPAGVYFVRIETNHGFVVRRIVKD